MKKRQQIIDKVKKLLRRGSEKNGNINECKLAMAIAQRLIAQYKIDRGILTETADEPKVERRYFKITQRAQEIPYVARIMLDHYQARVSYIPGMAYVYATEDSIENALYIAEFLYNNMRSALRAERRAAKKCFRLIDTRSFYLGFMSGVCYALEKQNAELKRASTQYAIICRTEIAIVNKYITEVVKPKVMVDDETPSVRDTNSFLRGHIRGEKTGIKKGIETPV